MLTARNHRFVEAGVQFLFANAGTLNNEKVLDQVVQKDDCQDRALFD